MKSELPAYFERIRQRIPERANVQALNRIIGAHVQTFAFENIDTWTGNVVDTSLPAIRQKMVQGARGGYCFETNALLKAVLTDFGFDVDALSARVRWGQKPDDLRISPRTHMALRVKNVPDENGEQQDYLVDVGFGGATPTAAIPWIFETPTRTPHGTVQIAPLTDPEATPDRQAIGDHVLQLLFPDGWRSIYTFDPTPAHPADHAMANWYVCTFPDSHFRHDLMLVLPQKDGTRLILNNLRFRKSRGHEVLQERYLSDADEALALLAEQFGIELADEAPFRARFAALNSRETHA